MFALSGVVGLLAKVSGEVLRRAASREDLIKTVDGLEVPKVNLILGFEGPNLAEGSAAPLDVHGDNVATFDAGLVDEFHVFHFALIGREHRSHTTDIGLIPRVSTRLRAI